MINPQNYLGQWADNGISDKDPDCIINCVSVDTQKMMARFESQTGKVRQISLIELDTSGRYTKIGSPYATAAVTEHAQGINKASSLREQAAPSAILGDLSKIGHRNQNRATTLRDSTVEPNIGAQIQTTPQACDPMPQAPTDPVSQFIDSAIQISRKSGAKTTLPIKINLEIDFDILNVTQMAMSIGASDVEILQHIMRYINIDPEAVKKLIINEIMQTPEDAKIVEEKREDRFDAILNEELAKQKYSDDPEDAEFKDLE